MAQHVARVKRVGADGGAATRVPAGGAQVMQPLEVAALAFPVPDRVVDELQLAQSPEIGDRKDRVEHALETGVFPFARQQVHLQEPLVGFLLDLDEIRDGYRRFDSGEVNSLPRRATCRILHSLTPESRKATAQPMKHSNPGPDLARPGSSSSQPRRREPDPVRGGVVLQPENHPRGDVVIEPEARKE